MMDENNISRIEKEYKNSALPGRMMDGMLKLLEESKLLDASLHVGDREFKAHKLVLAAACPFLLKKSDSFLTQVPMHLELPGDLDAETVESFIFFLYHGKLRINSRNIKDVYRISKLFQMEYVRNFCYDFAKTFQIKPIGHTGTEQIVPYFPISDLIDSMGNDADINTSTTVEEYVNNGARFGVTAEEKADMQLNSMVQNIITAVPQTYFSEQSTFSDESSMPVRKRGRSRIQGSQYFVQNLPVAPQIPEISTFPQQSVSPGHVDSMIEDPFKNNTPTTQSGVGTILSTPDLVSIASSSCEIPGVNSVPSVVEVTLESVNISVPPELLLAKGDNSSTGQTTKLDNTLNISALTPEILPKGDSSRVEPDVAEGTMVTRNRSKRRGPVSQTQKKRKGDKAEVKPGTKKGKSKTKEVKPHETTADTKPVEKTTESKQNGATAEEREKDVIAGKSTEDDATVEESAEKDRNFGKKARLRKTASSPEPIPEAPPKSQTMRPPPKKRTKEISEMMKRAIEFVHDLENSDDPLVLCDIPSKKTPPKKKQKTKFNDDGTKWVRKRNIYAESLMQKIKELERRSKGLKNDVQYRCMFCGNEFVFPKRIVTHIVKTHEIIDEDLDIDQYMVIEKKNPSPKVCDICGYKTKDPNFYYIHYHKYFRHGVPLPKGWKPYKCDICGKECFTKFQLRDHKLIHFEDTPFLCVHCGAGFKSRTSLNSHTFHRHNNIRKHACTECTKTFKTRTQVLVHMRVHTGEKPFRCPDCSYKSTTRGNMRLHLVNRHKFSSDKVKEIMSNLDTVFGINPDEEEEEISRKKEKTSKSKRGSSCASTNAIIEGVLTSATSMEVNEQYVPLPVVGSAQEPRLSQQPETTASEIPASQHLEDSGVASAPRGFFIDTATLAAATGIDPHTYMQEHNLPPQVRVLIQESGPNSGNEVRILLPDYNQSDSQDNGGLVATITESYRPEQQSSLPVPDSQSSEDRMLVRQIHSVNEQGRPYLQDVQSLSTQQIQTINSRNLVEENQLVHLQQALFQDGQSMMLEPHNQMTAEREVYIQRQSVSLLQESRPVAQENIPQRDSNSPLTPLAPSVLKPNSPVHSPVSVIGGYQPMSPQQSQSYLNGSAGIPSSISATIISVPAQMTMSESEIPNDQEQPLSPVPVAAGTPLPAHQGFEVVTSQGQLTSEQQQLLYQSYYTQTYPHGY